MHGLSKLNLFTSLFFIFFLTVHFLLFTPVVQYFCLCSEAVPTRGCTCNCAKCAARKGHEGSASNLTPVTRSAKFMSNGCAIPGTAGEMKTRTPEFPHISVETISCQCMKEVKNLLTELKLFIPVLFFGILVSQIALKLIWKYFWLYPEIFLPPQKRPG